ncbi:DUF397 domain-containing protein [Streptomyces sp. SS8]
MPELTWQRSSYCGNGGNNCVEIAIDGDDIAIRDSNTPEQVITTSSATFRSFISRIKPR